MSCLKRPLDGQDPDYEDTIPNEAKRLRLLEKNGNYVIVISSSFKFLTVFVCFKSAPDPINQKTLCEAKLNLRDTDTFISTEFSNKSIFYYTTHVMQHVQHIVVRLVMFLILVGLNTITFVM
jgi:hypothetical protein